MLEFTKRKHLGLGRKSKAGRWNFPRTWLGARDYRKAQFKLRLAIIAQHTDQNAGEGDFPATGFALWPLEADALRFGKLQRLLHLDDVAPEINAAPS